MTFPHNVETENFHLNYLFFFFFFKMITNFIKCNHKGDIFLVHKFLHSLKSPLTKSWTVNPVLILKKICPLSLLFSSIADYFCFLLTLLLPRLFLLQSKLIKLFSVVFFFFTDRMLVNGVLFTNKSFMSAVFVTDRI